LDLPNITNIELNNENKIHVDFILPKTNDCTIEFELFEKYTNETEYLPNSIKYTYEKNEIKQSLNEDRFEFDKPIILKHKIEYQVKALVKKQCLDHTMSRETPFKRYFIQVNFAFTGIHFKSFII
jgi:hypothetical protein